MSKTWKIMMFVLLALVLAQGAGLLYLWQAGQGSQARNAEIAALFAVSPPAKPAAPVTPVTKPAETTAQGSAPAPQYLPRPVQPMPGAGQALSSLSSARNPNALRAERARLVQRKIRELTANGRQPSPAELDPILQELAEIQGTSNIGGINIQALRDNLKVADRMQTLAKELEAEIKKPQAEQDMAKIKSIQDAILREQRGLRLDFMAGGAQPPVLPTPPIPAQPAPQPPAGQ
ncbi:MAG: hypothetical protein LBU45_00230 [Azoarcus sp.]|jgi:hypothetical protein|nr:hypothetical protein [Azoarcus sp.]